MKSLNIDRGGHLLPVNDQHHVVTNLYHHSIISQILFAWCPLHLVSRLLQHMFALLSSENFLRKWGSVSGSRDVMPSPLPGSSPLSKHCVELFMSLPHKLSCSLYLAVIQNSETIQRIWRMSGEIIFFLSSRPDCQNGPGLSEAAEAGVCLVMARRHTSSGEAISLSLTFALIKY